MEFGESEEAVPQSWAALGQPHPTQTGFLKAEDA